MRFAASTSQKGGTDMTARASDGFETPFIERGGGAPLVLIHGSVNDWRYWAPQMEALAAAPFRVLALSLRHYWPQPWDGKTGVFSIDEHVADVARFIAALDRGAVRVIGHSRGGYIAFRLAERHPELVRSLVLAEPAGVLDASLLPPGFTPGNYGALIADAVEAVRRGEIEHGLKLFFDYALGDGGWASLAPDRQQICRDNVLTLLGQISEGRTPYARAAAQALRMPTLIAVGGATQPAFRSVAEALAAAMPNAELADIPGARHLLNWDNAAAFNAAVLEFFARN